MVLCLQEKALGVTPSEMMDRDRAFIPEQQLQFLDNIAGPVYQLVVCDGIHVIIVCATFITCILYTCRYTLVCTLLRISNSNTHTCTHTHAHTHAHTCTHTCTHTCAHKHTCPQHTCTHAHRLLSRLLPESAEAYHTLLENREKWDQLKKAGKRGFGDPAE